MKILQINAVYGVGSTGVIVEDIHNLSFECGIDSYVAYSTTNKNPDEIKNGYVVGGMFGKKFHALLCRINGKQAYFSRFATKKLIKHILHIKPDTVHLHNLHSNYIHLNMLLKFLAKENIKTVITLHDCWFFTGGCFHYTSVGCDRWLKGCGSCPKKKQDTPAYFLDRSSRILADRKKYLSAIKDLTIIGVSKWITAEAQRSGIQAKQFITIHNGIDTDFFKPTLSNLRKELGLEGKFVVLGMANKWLQPINGETLRVVSEGLDKDSVLFLVGCKASDHKNLPPNVIPYGYIRDRDLLRKVYSMADVFVNCTREESLSLVNVEAQACGTPVITYKNTGAQETVDGTSGVAVENGNAHAMLNKILEIKRAGKKAFSNSCRASVCAKFRRDANYREMIDLYNRL